MEFSQTIERDFRHEQVEIFFLECLGNLSYRPVREMTVGRNIDLPDLIAPDELAADFVEFRTEKRISGCKLEKRAGGVKAIPPIDPDMTRSAAERVHAKVTLRGRVVIALQKPAKYSKRVSSLTNMASLTRIEEYSERWNRVSGTPY